MRSGSLPVVDGRYRTGMRVGPPLESHVKVERTMIDLTDLERAEAERGRVERRSDSGASPARPTPSYPGATGGPVRRGHRVQHDRGRSSRYQGMRRRRWGVRSGR